MAQNIITRSSIQELAKYLKENYATKAEVNTDVAGLPDAIKGAKITGTKITLYTDKAMSTEPAFTLDLPADMVLDQAQTKFVGSFAWGEGEDYPGGEDPSLEGKPVMVLAVKGEGENPNFSFLDMSKLVDTYKAAAGNGTVTVTVSGYTISADAKVSAEANNVLEAKDDGLYVPKPAAVDISGKLDKVAEATEGNFASFGAGGVLADSGKKAADFMAATAASTFVAVADISDFSEEEIVALFTAEEP